MRVTSYAERTRGRLEYAVIRAPRGMDDETLARALDAAERRVLPVALPSAANGWVSGYHPDDVPKLVARILSDPLSSHDRAQLTLVPLAAEDPPETFKAEIRQVRAAETVRAFRSAYEELLSALAAHGSQEPAADARLRFGICHETEVRRRRDWKTDRGSRA